MTGQRPAWADALTNVLGMMKEQAPVATMLQLVQMMAPGSVVTDADLAEFLKNARGDDPTIFQFRLALAKWDADDSIPDADGNATVANTVDRRAAIYSALGLSQQATNVLTRRCGVLNDHTNTMIASTDFEPWYPTGRVSVYWKNYSRYLQQTRGWSAESIATLNRSSTAVIERLSNPTREGKRPTKGLVVGYVQSGKTANFTGVVAKAIDEGYRLVIVLTGTIEMLRAQTQRRLDMELIGYENILAGRDPDDPSAAAMLDYQQEDDWPDKFVHHGSDLTAHGVVRITRLTTHGSDFRSHPAGIPIIDFKKISIGHPLNHFINLSHNNANIAVVKKNGVILDKLLTELARLSREVRGDLPVLIIDDESDQAGVNTNDLKSKSKSVDDESDQSPTKINGQIRRIIKLFSRAQYVGYTATPYANVFIDLEEEDELYPSDFVLSLNPPPDYMGIQEFHDVGKEWDGVEPTFSNSNELAHVRPITADPDVNPAGRTEELLGALDSWVLAGAIKKYREANSDLKFPHHTMLVHESVSRIVHEETAKEIKQIWGTAQFNSESGHSRLRKLFEKDFLPVMHARADGAPIPPNFESLKLFVGEALAEMEADSGAPVLIVNSDPDYANAQKRLDFRAHPVWLILVGGAKLSRGFTIEGLTVTYFRRKTNLGDTLMQAGRWFGFRPGYQDLVRLYLLRTHDVDLYQYFEGLLLDEEAFREQLEEYAKFDKDGKPRLEPRGIPLLIFQHLPWLRPTARNKMRKAVVINQAPTGLHELYGLPERGHPSNARNFNDVVIPLLKSATTSITLPYEFNGNPGQQLSARAGLISAQEALDLLNRHEWHPDHMSSVIPIRKFLHDAEATGKITDWAVVLPDTAGRRFFVSELGAEVPVVKRKRRANGYSFVGSDPRHRAAVARIARGEHVPGLGASTTRGVIFLYITPDRDPDTDHVTRKDLVGLIAVAAPTSALSGRGIIQYSVPTPQRADAVASQQTDAR